MLDMKLVDLVDANRGEPRPPVQRRALDVGEPQTRTPRRRHKLYAARRSGLRALRAQASRALCLANEPASAAADCDANDGTGNLWCPEMDLGESTSRLPATSHPAPT